MHKWKDKVELSLDNRQIFFLFFGLSVVGCFVFALGVMVGRRVEWSPEGEVAALSGNSLALFEQEEQPDELSFKAGLSDPATDEVPPTRDPSEPPRDEDEVKAEKAAKAAEAKANAKADKPPKAVPVAAPAVPHGATLAKGDAKASVKPKAGDAKRFTLQMKAFSRAEEAEAFAGKLRANGHQVRVEAHEVKGRIWHRVRMGSFDNWQDGLAAKQDFEQSEKVIAYVVRL